MIREGANILCEFWCYRNGDFRYIFFFDEIFTKKTFAYILLDANEILRVNKGVKILPNFDHNLSKFFEIILNLSWIFVMFGVFGLSLNFLESFGIFQNLWNLIETNWAIYPSESKIRLLALSFTDFS